METATEPAWWQRVADGVRVELFTQRRTVRELCAHLGRGTNYVSLRLNGHEPFKMSEIEAAAEWLGVSIESLKDKARF